MAPDSESEFSRRRSPGGRVSAPATPVLLRYSRFVSLMKVVLPALAAALLGLVFVWPKLGTRDAAFHLAFGDFNVKAVDTLSMQHPRYFGTDAKNQPFTVTADVATQVDPANMVVSLENPVADLTRQGGGNFIVNADTGFFRQKEDILDLMGHVDLYEDTGYELHTESIRLEVKLGNAIGDEPAHGQGPSGTIQGEGLRLWERGRTIMFTGKAKAVLYMTKPKAPKP